MVLAVPSILSHTVITIAVKSRFPTEINSAGVLSQSRVFVEKCLLKEF